MLINPNTAIQEGWIQGVTNPELQVQPNAIDFTVDDLYHIGHHDLCVISEDKSERQMRSSAPVDVSHVGEDGREWWTLSPNMVYDGLSKIYVDLPEGIACSLIIRSTFNRNGMFLTSGLYDSGYQGRIGFALHNRSGMAQIQRGVRVGQILFMPSDAAKMYAGGWNHSADTHWNEEARSVQ